MALTLTLAKPGDEVKKLKLNLAKPAVFSIELFWDSPHDLDAHALLATNNGGGAKVSSFEQVLSTYNMKKTNPGGALTPNADGSFSTPDGALTHSGDVRTGVNTDVDETITINGAKVPAGVNEIPIFITIHPSHSAKFAEVKEAGVRIRNDQGVALADFKLSKEFGEFDAVQMGSVVLGDGGWSFAQVGVGFNGDFNTVLENFS
ncbi:TerD family protein [Candidatus Kaiserbacteria bacterium]|nr:TerD family protein [Candidatus Kaiserbacteria bacterium]